jgi:predicted phage terminase large subunit-like protein
MSKHDDELEIIKPPKKNSANISGFKKGVSNLPRKDGKSFFPSNTVDHTYEVDPLIYDAWVKKTSLLHVQALFDFWKFIDLIELHGGTKAYDAVFHKDMALFTSQTQSQNCKHRRKIGLVSRGHAKSTLGTVAKALWRIYRNPNIRICMATATKDLALDFVRFVKQYLEDEDLQDKIWNNRPHIPGRLVPILDKAGASRRNQRWDLGDYTEAQDKKIIWRADAIQVNRDVILKEPTVLASSPKSTITGKHFDLMILDDIIDEETIATEDKRAKTVKWAAYLESLVDPEYSMQIAPGFREMLGNEVDIWGTRYHLEDYYSYILDNLEDFEYKLFLRNVYKNGIDDSEGYTWSARFNKKTVDRIKKIQGVVVFSAQYLNKVVATEDVIFDTGRIRYLNVQAVAQHQSKRGFLRVTRKSPIDEEVETIDLRPFAVIDPAISTKKTADYSVVMVGGVDSERSLYVLDFRFGRWLPNELIKNTYDLLDKYDMVAVHIETVGYQLALIQMFKAAFVKYRPISLIQYKPQGKKEDRIKYHLQPIFDNNQIFLQGWMKNCQELMDELNYFPTIHDDIVDAMSMVVEVSNPTKQEKKKVIYGRMDNIIRGRFTLNERYGGRLR